MRFRPAHQVFQLNIYTIYSQAFDKLPVLRQFWLKLTGRAKAWNETYETFRNRGINQGSASFSSAEKELLSQGRGTAPSRGNRDRPETPGVRSKKTEAPGVSYRKSKKKKKSAYSSREREKAWDDFRSHTEKIGEKMYSHRKRKTGLPPGTLSESTAGKKSSIHMITYTETQVKETFDDMEMLEGARKLKGTVWINITGIEDSDLIRKIGENFDIHPLILEDIQNTDQRAKVENHTKYLYLVTKRLIWNASEQITEDEQISFILFKNIILTFQEHEGDTFDTIRSRIREKKGRIRNNGADYLLYALIDSIVDYYFTPLEELQEEVDATEQKISTTGKRRLNPVNSTGSTASLII